jgi:hypothetical protein
MEKIIGINSDNALEIALHYYGQELTLFRQQANTAFSRVHAKNAGGDLELVTTFDGILKSDDFSTSDGHYSANFEEGFLFTKEKGILTGDVIKIDAGGGVRKFLVVKMEDIGYSTDMFVQWKLSNMN